jgi:hypothetical protein
MIKTPPTLWITFAPIPRNSRENQGGRDWISYGKTRGMLSVVRREPLVIRNSSLIVHRSSFLPDAEP